MGASCKTGDWKDCLRTMEIVVEAWKRSEHGERLHGPILSVASNSDAKRVRPTFSFVGAVLTLQIGARGLVTSNAGLVVKNTCINRDLLFSWLERLTNHDWSEPSLHVLLDPADGQNVSGTIKLMLAIIELASLDKTNFDPSEAVEFEALCLLAEFLNAWIQPYINTDLSLSEQIESLILASHLCAALYLQNASVKNAVLMVAKTRVINGELKVFVCLLGDDVLEALFGRARMIGGHSPNCSIGELRDRFVSAMNLNWIYEQYPEFERQPRRLDLMRMRHVDHLRPRHFKRELCAKSCDLPVVWKSAVRKAEAILAKYGVQMAVPFAVLFSRPETNLLRHFGGKYPALSSKADRSVADSTGVVVDPSVDTDTRSFSSSVLIPTEEFDKMFAAMKPPPDATHHSLFATINDKGRQAHKKTIVRTFFEMTHDIHTSRDRIQRVRGFTYGGKSWTRENREGHQTLSPSTHFQHGQLFTTLISYNNTNLALAVAKCTMIRKTGSKTSSTSAVPRAELNLPESVYTISGQVLSLVALAQRENAPDFTWDGEFVSLSLNKKGQNGDVSRIHNLQFSVPSRLVDAGIHERAHQLLALDSEAPCTQEKTWSFFTKDLLTAWSCVWNGWPRIKVCTINSRSSRKSQTGSSPMLARHPQMHVGEHILKSICGVAEPSAKFPVSKEYPCGTCGGPTGIKNGKLDSNCPLTYAFMVSVAGQFRDTHSLEVQLPTASPGQAPSMEANSIPRLISTIQIGAAEQEALGIPRDNVIGIPATAPPLPSLPPPSRGQKRPAPSPPSSPSRRANKENEGIPASNSNTDLRAARPPKIRKLILKLGPAPDVQKNSCV
ncbi:hypothetical protein C8F04DRAFT_1241929 [Mycena alexandri]|uniref:Uncharacterized protein n=1 Tax=Mycena alexandri TaxID=1745969 RepID=A0AAD6WPL5_9AGAR|nr:hypothetical protein C8F04DRAFT_1241929 [Mycena alexandri]